MTIFFFVILNGKHLFEWKNCVESEFGTHFFRNFLEISQNPFKLFLKCMGLRTNLHGHSNMNILIHRHYCTSILYTQMDIRLYCHSLKFHYICSCVFREIPVWKLLNDLLMEMHVDPEQIYMVTQTWIS